MARVTSWTDQGMDWDNPNLTDWRYVDALSKAVNEREVALGWTPTALPDFEGRYLNKTILQDIRNKVRTLIPNFINHTAWGNTFTAREHDTRWSINAISELTGFGSVTFENSDMSISAFNEHAKKLYNTINLLRYLNYRTTQEPFIDKTNCDRYSQYTSLWGWREPENPMLSYAHPHVDINEWQTGTSGMGDNDSGGLCTVWNALAMSNWSAAEWGDNSVDTVQHYTFSLYSAAQSGNGHSGGWMGSNSAWIKAWRNRGKVKMTFPTAGNASDDVIVQIWQTRQITAVIKTLSRKVYPYTVYYENTSTTDNTPVLIEETTLQNNQESTEIDTQKLEVDMVEVLDRVKMADAASSTQSIYEITRDFMVKVSMGTPQPLSFAFKDW